MRFRLSPRSIETFISWTKLCTKTAVACCALLFACMLITAGAQETPKPTGISASAANSGAAARDAYVGNEACAKCHSSIYDKYKNTPMAHASGLAMENFIPGEFTHRRSGVHYRIYSQAGHAWLSFDRDGNNPLHGKRELLYYIGSGQRGLTYLFADDGFVFESPINWYGDQRVWDMTPAYQNATEIPLNLPAHTSCLHCHVSGMRPPLDGTENRYQMPLLTHSGVSCERCHGAGAAHLKSGPIVNPAKLTPDRRDAICMQCHMEGRVSVERAGKHIYDFRPGDSLADYVRYYVLADSSAKLGAVSQVEAFAQSTCKKASGDRMSCTSCHDPHYSPAPQERVAYFRGKCLACHGAEFGAKHHAKQQDCTACHMPQLASKDVAHTEVTDHRIPRVPEVSPQLLQDARTPSTDLKLAPFPDSPEAENDLRDLALAWESLANRGVATTRPRAQQLLLRSAAQFPNDGATLSALAYEDQLRGDLAQARTLYERALAADPDLFDAATNLGVIQAEAGDFPKSISLLQGAFDRAPGRSSVGLDLARVYCLAGEFDKARASTARVLEFNPDLRTAKDFLKDLQVASPNCNGS